MGTFNILVLIDFANSLAVLALLVLCFGAVVPGLRQGGFALVFLGAFFGCVAGLQMTLPLSPVDGVIVDLRNIPVVLAGAFLGLRGAAVCLLIGVAIRLGIGGAGVQAGVLSMLISVGVGLIWAHVKDRLTLRLWGQLVALGAAVNLNLLSAAFAPPDIARWFYSEVAPTLFCLNFLCVPVLGWMLTRERNKFALHLRLSAAATVDPKTRLLPIDAFAEEVAHFHASDRNNSVCGLAAVTLKNASWVSHVWGDAAVDKALGALRVRFRSIGQDQRPLGLDAHQRILVPVLEREDADMHMWRKNLRRLAVDTPLALGNGIELPISVLVQSFRLTNPDNPRVISTDIIRSVAQRERTQMTHSLPQGPEPGLPVGVNSPTFRRLFDETDKKMAHVPFRA